MLTDSQKQSLAAALRADANQTVVDALAGRNDSALAQYCNTASAQDVWNEAMSAALLFEATDITQFDGLTAGKRDAWRLLMQYAPVDMRKNKLRKAVEDAWGPSNSVAVLQACVRKATYGELYFGGNSATTNTVTGMRLNFYGQITVDDIGSALRDY
jgi:hypothetical protein